MGIYHRYNSDKGLTVRSESKTDGGDHVKLNIEKSNYSFDDILDDIEVEGDSIRQPVHNLPHRPLKKAEPVCRTSTESSTRCSNQLRHR